MESEIEAMVDRMTEWIVEHMDQQELIALAYEIVARNISEMGSAEIKAQHADMFGE